MAKRIKKAEDGEFSQKWLKVLLNTNSAFIEEAESMNEEDLKKTILDAEKSIVEQEKLAEADENLKAARENVKLLGAAYKDAKAYQTAKLKFCLHQLEKQGK